MNIIHLLIVVSIRLKVIEIIMQMNTKLANENKEKVYYVQMGIFYILYKLPASTYIQIYSMLNRLGRSCRETRPQPVIDSPLYTVPTCMRGI